MSEFFNEQWKRLQDRAREDEVASPGPNDVWNLALGWVIDTCREMYREDWMSEELCRNLQQRCRAEMSAEAKIVRHDV